MHWIWMTLKKLVSNMAIMQAQDENEFEDEIKVKNFVQEDFTNWRI